VTRCLVFKWSSAATYVEKFLKYRYEKLKLSNNEKKTEELLLDILDCWTGGDYNQIRTYSFSALIFSFLFARLPLWDCYLGENQHMSSVLNNTCADSAFQE